MYFTVIYDMSTNKYLDNIIKARVELMKSIETTVDYHKRREIESMMLDIERSLSRFLKTEIGLNSLDKKDEIVFYEPDSDDSDEISGEFAPIHPAEYDSDCDELTLDTNLSNPKASKNAKDDAQAEARYNEYVREFIEDGHPFVVTGSRKEVKSLENKIITIDSDEEYTTISMRQNTTHDLCGND